MSLRQLSVSMGVLLSVVALAVPARAAWDDKAAGELKTMCEKMFAAWEKGDGATIKSMIATDMFMGAWDLDMMGKPATWASADEVAKTAQMMAAELKKMGATMKNTIKKIDCKASGELGVCVVQGEASMTMPGMPTMTMAFRGNDTLRKGADGWKFVHHHGSVAKAFDMPGKSMAWTSKTAPWQPTPTDGLKMAAFWMDPATMSVVGVMKAEKDIKQARHVHPAGMAFTIIEGKISTTDPSGKVTEYGPGTAFYRAAGEPHTTEIKAGTTAFVASSGPMQEIYVDEKDKPTAPMATK